MSPDLSQGFVAILPTDKRHQAHLRSMPVSCQQGGAHNVVEDRYSDDPRYKCTTCSWRGWTIPPTPERPKIEVSPGTGAASALFRARAARIRDAVLASDALTPHTHPDVAAARAAILAALAVPARAEIDLLCEAMGGISYARRHRQNLSSGFTGRRGSRMHELAMAAKAILGVASIGNFYAYFPESV